MSNSAACREVGINRRTGTRRRYGRKTVDRAGHERVHAPITEERRRVGTSDRFPAEDVRLVIADLLLSGNPLRAIARDLDRSPATISREVRRNSDPRTGEYHPTRPRAGPPCAAPARRRARYGVTRN
ncbi:helix-turn-helix domain-containing protein [Embleya sp. NPDC059259]|uniref:helix-turn-helix domain-containing protein n=1 Tax=unclassified Embleya TaxID=2699296 RepID=UPI00368B420E